MKHITLCADDYGQNPAISQAIINLLAKKRLSATSCMTTSNYWPEHAKWLEPFKNQTDIGLHFNLTEDTPIAMPLKKLLIKSQFRQLDIHVLKAEFNRQLDLFEEHMQMLPDFIDGHQHVHQFPVIRDAVLDVYESRLRAKNAYMRCTYSSDSLLKLSEPGFVKKAIINFTGGIAFKNLLLARNIPHNASFSGVYDFRKAQDYAALFQAFAKNSDERGLIMCHPGLSTNDHPDEIATSRAEEYAYFNSAQFEQDAESLRFLKLL